MAAAQEEPAKGGPDLITIADMPARLEAAGLPVVTVQRIRRLAQTDPDWPVPLDEAVKVGRIRLFDWRVMEPYFRARRSRQGQRTDLGARPSTDGGGRKAT